MRNLGLILALWSAVLLPTNSLALGLGEIEVKSFLNQPLNAEIEVISARPGEIDDLLVSLASRDAFTRAGLSRPRHLTDLRFAVRKDESGETAVVVVTTKDAVKEPFLNFLIEADWSKGRVLREFTILLDPPFYADQPAPATETAAAVPEPTYSDEQSVSAIVEQAGVTTTTEPDSAVAESEPIAEPIAMADESPQPEPASDEYVSDATQNIIEGDVLVVKGDTLWSIASRFKDDAHSMAQVMLAFQRANPEAFTDGNINNMKEGAILRAPSALELDAMGQQEAYAEVLVQNGLWDEYVARVTGTEPAMATQTDDVMAGESDAAEQVGELSLVMPAEGDSESTGISDSADVDELRTKLALAEEELDAARIENAELESRIAELQARLSKVEELQKMVEIEDDSLAQLEAQQAAEDEMAGEELVADESVDMASESEPVVPEEAVSEAIQADEEALLEELLAEEAAAQAEEQAAIDGGSAATDTGAEEVAALDEALVEDEMVSDEMADDTMADDEMLDDELAADETAVTEESETTAPAPPPVVITEPAREPSMLDGILPPEIVDMLPSLGGLGAMLGNPIVLAALGGVVVLLLVLMLLKRRRAAADEDDTVVTPVNEDDMFAGEEEEELTPIHLADGSGPDETDIKVPADEDMMPAQQPAEEVAEDDFDQAAVAAEVETPEPEAPAPAAPSEQDDVLNEVDVYLAYGLYDNAEELLSSNLVENPDRADYRAKLLDTYFATKKADAFVDEAEKLKSMGDAASPYWDRVQIMGYELAPDNALFSDAKDSGLSAADLEFTKPQEADFDLGAGDEDDTNFSTTDFNLGEEDTGGDFTDTQNMGEAGEIAETQQIPQLEGLPDLDEDDETNIGAEALGDSSETELELPDEIGDELEFSMEEDEPTPAAEATSVLDLPDDLDLGGEEDQDLDLDAADVDMDEIAAEFDAADDETGSGDESEMDLGAEFEAALEDADDLDLDDAEMIPFGDDDEEPTSVEATTDEDAVELSPPEETTEYEATSVITPNYEDTEVVPAAAEEALSLDDDASEIDLGMDDTSMMAEDSEQTGELNLDTGELQLPGDDDDDDEDISIIDFGGDDFVEPTDVVESIDDEAVAMDVDADDGEEVKTGTFAPGDFEEPTAATESIADIDDIGDLMLPDDVDEVSTKLDLARAFIDMGDTEGARGSLEEVIAEGNEEQKTEAKALLDQI